MPRRHAGRLRGAAGPGALPRRHRPQGRGRDVRGPGQPGQGPARVPAPRRGADAGARPGRGAGRGDGQRDQLQHRLDLDLRAGADVRVPRALRPAVSPLSKRHDLPYHVRRLRPVRRRAAHRPRRARLEAGRRGGGPLPVGRAGEPGRAQRHDARPGAADLGLRDQLRRPGRARPGEVQPADAQAGPPHLGGGRVPRTGQLDGVPPAGLAQRRGDEAGRRRADLGRLRRPGLLRHAVRPQRRRDPGVRRLQRGQGGDRPQHGRRADHRPQRRGLPVLEGRDAPRTPRSGSGSASGSASSPAATTSTSSSSTRAARPSALSVFVARKGGTIVTCASAPAASCTSTTTATSG